MNIKRCEKVYCKSCGELLKDNVLYCCNCGGKVEHVQDTNSDVGIKNSRPVVLNYIAGFRSGDKTKMKIAMAYYLYVILMTVFYIYNYRSMFIEDIFFFIVVFLQPSFILNLISMLKDNKYKNTVLTLGGILVACNLLQITLCDYFHYSSHELPFFFEIEFWLWIFYA